MSDLFWWAANNGSWTAQITVNYKRIVLGLYRTKDEAIAARKAAEKIIGFHPNHGRRQAKPRV